MGVGTEGLFEGSLREGKGKKVNRWEGVCEGLLRRVEGRNVVDIR